MEIIFPRGDAPEKVAKNSVAVGTIKREQEVKEDGRKEKMVDATTIGYKKIIDLQGVETDAIEIRIEDSRVAPVISFVGVY